VIWMKNDEHLKRWTAGRDRIFIYRPFEKEIGPEGGFFKIVKGSHQMSEDEIKKTAATSIRLKLGQAMIMDGGCAIEYPREGGGLGMFKSIYKRGP
jgi:hypothetical protein